MPVVVEEIKPIVAVEPIAVVAAAVEKPVEIEVAVVAAPVVVVEKQEQPVVVVEQQQPAAAAAAAAVEPAAVRAKSRGRKSTKESTPVVAAVAERVAEVAAVTVVVAEPQQPVAVVEPGNLFAFCSLSLFSREFNGIESFLVVVAAVVEVVAKQETTPIVAPIEPTTKPVEQRAFVDSRQICFLMINFVFSV